MSTDYAKLSVSFRSSEDTRVGLYGDIKTALGLLGLAQLAVAQLEDLLPEIVRLNLAAHPSTSK